MGLDPPSLSSFFTFWIALFFVYVFAFIFRFIFGFRSASGWVRERWRASDNPQRRVNRNGEPMWLVRSEKKQREKKTCERIDPEFCARATLELTTICECVCESHTRTAAHVAVVPAPDDKRTEASPHRAMRHQSHRIDGCMRCFN